MAISHPWRAIKASREVAGQVPPSIRRPGRRSSSDEVEFSFGQLASVVHGVHCDLPSTGEWPIQSPCEHIGSALAADPVNPFTDSAQIRHFVMAITAYRFLRPAAAAIMARPLAGRRRAARSHRLAAHRAALGAAAKDQGRRAGILRAGHHRPRAAICADDHGRRGPPVQHVEALRIRAARGSQKGQGGNDRFHAGGGSDLPLVHAGPKQGAAPAKEISSRIAGSSGRARRSADDGALRR